MSDYISSDINNMKYFSDRNNLVRYWYWEGKIKYFISTSYELHHSNFQVNFHISRTFSI